MSDSDEIKQQALECDIEIDAFNTAKRVMEEDFGEILGYYIEESDRHVEEIEKALTLHNIELAQLPAHTLKTSSRQFGAMKLGELSYEVEKAAAEKKPVETIDDLVTQIKEEYAKAKDFLMPYLETEDA